MNKLLKLSTTALLLSGLLATGTAMAAFKAPTVRADKMTAINGAGDVDVAANDLNNDGTGITYTAGKAKYGTVTCTAAGACTYTATEKAKGKKTDQFSYTVTYKDAKGKTKKRVSYVKVTLKSEPVSGAPV